MTARLATVETEPLTVTVKQAAELIGVSTWQIYQLLGQDKIEGRYLGRKRLIMYASLKSYVEALPEDPEDAA